MNGTHNHTQNQSTRCAGCGETKETPLRRDDMGGYVCLTCVDKRLSAVSRQLQLIREAITEAMHKMEANPNDSPQDIFNESLKSWETGLRMNHRYEVEQADLDAEFDANRR